MKASRTIIQWSFAVVFLGITIFLAFNKHSKSGYFTYHSEIWADKAGYYVYLPAALKYGFDPSQFPDSIEAKTGDGFHLDQQNKVVLTKYTCGVALLQAPFYLLADLLAEPLGYASDGFSPIYHWSINLAAVFYLLLGLLLLRSYLRENFSDLVVYLSLFFLFLGTNLYHYAIDETGMSHVYSFALFAAYLVLLQRTQFLKSAKWSSIFLFGLIAGLALMVRPTSVLFLIAAFFLDLEGSSFKERFLGVLSWRIVLLTISGLFLVILPQLLYWFYSHNSILVYSYGEEGFNWLQPQFLATFLSPNNGLFLYSPFYIIPVVGIALMMRGRQQNGLIIGLLLLGVSYVLSCWWDWSFGCSYGGRSFVEYLAVLAIPLAYFVHVLLQMKWKRSITIWIVMLAMVAFNMKNIYSYDGCYYGAGDWDWQAYITFIQSPTK